MHFLSFATLMDPLLLIVVAILSFFFFFFCKIRRWIYLLREINRGIRGISEMKGNHEKRDFLEDDVSHRRYSGLTTLQVAH